MIKHDSPDTLTYLDPPYVHDTRSMGNRKRSYRHEMTDDQHSELIAAARAMRGMVVLSGYDSELYNDLLSNWSKQETMSRISAGRGTETRKEVLWLNNSVVARNNFLDLAV